MTILPSVVEVVLPIFMVIALGYGVGIRRWIGESSVQGLSIYVFNIAVPLLLFKSMSVVTLPEMLPWRGVIGYFGCAIGLLISIFFVARFWLRDNATAGVFAFCASYGNFIPLGIPLVLMAFGDEATVPLFILVAFQAPLFFPIMILIQERARAREHRDPMRWPVLKSVIRNQFLLGIGLGAAINIAGVSLPPVLVTSLDLIGQSAGPAALFTVGAALSFYPIRGVLRSVAVIVVVKNVLLPLLVWQVAKWLGLPHIWQAVMVVMAALPVGINGYLFAERYKCAQPLAGSAAVISMGVSLVTLSVVLALIKA